MSELNFKYQNLLIAMLAEECSEVVQDCMKELRFGEGPHTADNGQEYNNRERISSEIGDLLAVLEIMDSNDMINLVEIRASLPQKIGRKIRGLRTSMELNNQPNNTNILS